MPTYYTIPGSNSTYGTGSIFTGNYLLTATGTTWSNGANYAPTITYKAVKPTKEQTKVENWSWQHAIDICDDSFPCPVHRPSEWALAAAPAVWDEVSKQLTRRCEHGLLHFDVDDCEYRARNGKPWTTIEVGCCGCCVD